MKIPEILLLLLISVSCTGNGSADIKTGAEQPDKYLQSLQGKKLDW